MHEDFKSCELFVSALLLLQEKGLAKHVKFECHIVSCLTIFSFDMSHLRGTK